MSAVLAVNAFQGVMIGIFVGVLAMILALGQWSTRSAADYLDWKPTRPPEADEADDLEQMLAAQNALRRRRGLPERTAADVGADVRRAQAELDGGARTDEDGRWRAS